MALAKYDELEVVGTLGEGQHVIDVVSETECDIVLLDLELPDLDGTALLDQLIEELEITVIVVTGSNRAHYIDTALKAGVRCVVSKADSTEHLFLAISSALKGERYISPTIAKLIGTLEVHDIVLSKRQKEILRILNEGQSNKEIGYRLGIKAPTVSFHLNELRKKLNVESNNMILMKAKELRLL